MIKFLLKIFPLLLWLPLFSQDCQYEKNEIDETTLLPVKRTTFVSLCKVNRSPFECKAHSIGNNKYLKIRYYRYNDFYIPADQPLIFIMEDSSGISLTAIQPRRDSTNLSSMMTVSSLLVYELSEETFEMLTSQPVIMIRYYQDNEYISVEVKDKSRLLLKQILDCIR